MRSRLKSTQMIDVSLHVPWRLDTIEWLCKKKQKNWTCWHSLSEIIICASIYMCKLKLKQIQLYVSHLYNKHDPVDVSAFELNNNTNIPVHKVATNGSRMNFLFLSIDSPESETCTGVTRFLSNTICLLRSVEHSKINPSRWIINYYLSSSRDKFKNVYSKCHRRYIIASS